MKLKPISCVAVVLSSAFLAFGLYHVHSFSGVTEGGVLGMTLLLEHWLHISPAVSGFVMNVLCYAMGWRLLGREFIGYSAVAAAGFSAAYKVFEQFPPLWTQLADMPLAASVVGAVFVGVGAGVCVRVGGATGGDDALAMCVSHVTHWNIQWVYLLSDFLVLALSVSYIPLNRIGWSVVTVILSGQMIGLIQKIKLPAKMECPESEK
ncbi:YitT family protein [Flintibacter muris]|uniref:YitT family protein n=1 Tax=Flintibacter muris TaxID=2941327 RepID=UPI00203A5C30|nr:YitT family protein [Flintibacter muris]